MREQTETPTTHTHMESGYGFFCGGDPRDFHPDPEASTDAERAKHAADCAAWDAGERPNVNHNAPHFVSPAMHVIPGGYGLGGYSLELECEDPECPQYVAPTFVDPDQLDALSGADCPECETPMLAEPNDVERCPECDTSVWRPSPEWTTTTLVSGVVYALHVPCQRAFVVPQDHDCTGGAA